MSFIPRYLPVFTAGSTSSSVPADCPHIQWQTSWFVVWCRRCRVSSQLYMPSQYPAHLFRTPPLSVISLLSLLSITAALCYLVSVRSLVCRRTLLFPAFIPFFMASRRSSIQFSLVDLIFFLTSLCNVGTVHCFVI